MKNKYLLGTLAFLLAAVALNAQELTKAQMERPLNEWQLNLTTLGIAAMFVGRIYQGLKNGGGLVGIWRGIVFGTNVPKAIAQDYKEELKTDNKGGANVAKVGMAILFLTLVGAAVTTGLTGCNTILVSPVKDEIKIQRISSTVTGLTSSAVALTVSKHPEYREYFQAAAEVIQIAVGEGNVAPESLRSVLNDKLGKNADIVNSSLSVAFGLYQTFYGLNVGTALDEKPAFRAVLEGLVAGIKSGSAGASSSSQVHDLSIEDLKLAR